MGELVQVQEETNLWEQYTVEQLSDWLNANKQSPLHWAVLTYLSHLVLTGNAKLAGDSYIATPESTDKLRDVAWALIYQRQLHIKFVGYNPEVYYEV